MPLPLPFVFAQDDDCLNWRDNARSAGGLPTPPSCAATNVALVPYYSGVVFPAGVNGGDGGSALNGCLPLRFLSNDALTHNRPVKRVQWQRFSSRFPVNFKYSA
ncbi:hypothetical protein [Candidatus Spongiihabitans sp.]|uniref:hypothetical protein n=1 Tax=Candidatus Spongiihabitans sp. TaxID=3101308 RepID=UPI003C6F9E79